MESNKAVAAKSFGDINLGRTLTNGDVMSVTNVLVRPSDCFPPEI